MPDELIYSRQREIELYIPRSITIAGVGGVGFWVAVDSALSGVPNLYLFDPDVLEEHNRNRLPVCQSSLNKPKVEVAKEYILAIRPDAIVVAIQDRLEGILLDIQVSVSNIIIECTDSPKAQYIIYNACEANHIPFIRAGYDGTHIMITSSVTGWIPNQVEQENYTVIPSWVVPTQIAAALAVGKMMKYFNQEVSLDISEIGIPFLQKKSRLTPRCRRH